MKVFWSWQNDWSPNVNRYLIQNALTDAVAQLGDSFESAERPELDHDTKGLAGAVEIAKEILKKIDSSAAFVADVTPIGKSDGGKALPNPNVMIELGWALKSPGEAKVILLMNTACGFSPSKLPFDIFHRRIMTYHLDPAADAAGRRSEQARLTAALREALELNLHASSRQPASDSDCAGVSPAQDDPSVWTGFLAGIDHEEHGRQIHVDVQASPRAYIRVIPAGWRAGSAPPVSAIASLQPGVQAPSYRSADGSYGPCAEGFVRYWFLPSGESRRLNGLTMYFDETGEFWSFISLGDLMSNLDIPAVLKLWSKSLSDAMSAYEVLGASPTYRVELGITGLKKRGWRFPNTHYPPRKDLKPVSRTSDQWSSKDQLDFVTHAYNQILDLYGLGPSVTTDVEAIVSH